MPSALFKSLVYLAHPGSWDKRLQLHPLPSPNENSWIHAWFSRRLLLIDLVILQILYYDRIALECVAKHIYNVLFFSTPYDIERDEGFLCKFVCTRPPPPLSLSPYILDRKLIKEYLIISMQW